jgi:hypothetical protein
MCAAKTGINRGFPLPKVQFSDTWPQRHMLDLGLRDERSGLVAPESFIAKSASSTISAPGTNVTMMLEIST